MIFIDGMKVRCIIDGISIESATISIEDDIIYICQNHKCGDYCRDLHGYEYSWYCGDGSRDSFHNQGVTHIEPILISEWD